MSSYSWTPMKIFLYQKSFGPAYEINETCNKTRQKGLQNNCGPMLTLFSWRLLLLLARYQSGWRNQQEATLVSC